MIPSAVSVVVLYIGSAVVRVAHTEGAGDMVVGVRGVVVGVNMRLMVMRGGLVVRVVTKRTGEKRRHNLLRKYQGYHLSTHRRIDLQLRALSVT